MSLRNLPAGSSGAAELLPPLLLLLLRLLAALLTLLERRSRSEVGMAVALDDAALACSGARERKVVGPVVVEDMTEVWRD